MSKYHLMSDRELEIEAARIQKFQHEYARLGLVRMAHCYAGKLVEISLEQAKRPLKKAGQ